MAADTKTPVPGLTASKIAVLWRVTPAAVGKWHRLGCPRRPDNTYDLREVIAWRERYIAEQHAESDWETEGQKWRALRHKHELETRQGQYLLAADAAAWWADRVTEARTALLGIGMALAPSLVGRDVQEICSVIDARLRAVCEDLARKVEKSLTEQDAPDGQAQEDA